MTDEYIFQMPCLSKYAFNIDGDCIRGEPRHKMTLYKGYCDARRIWKPKPHYYLMLDNGQYERITLAEVQQYIRHSEYVMETVMQERKYIRA